MSEALLSIENEGLRRETARLRDELKKVQADKLIDNMKAVETEEKLRAAIEDLLSFIDNEDSDCVEAARKAIDWLEAEVTRLQAVVVHVAACNPDAAGDSAVVALRQIVSHAREALTREEK